MFRGGLEGAPEPPPSEVQKLVSRYNSIKDPTPPGDPKHWYSKVATGLVMAGKGSPEEKMAMLHPVYTAQLERKQAERARLGDQIKTLDAADEIQSKEQARREATQDRRARIMEAATAHGGQFIPADAPVSDDMVPMPMPPGLADDPRLAGLKLVTDKHFGMFKVNPEQAKIVGGAVRPGDWVPQSALDKIIQGGIDRGKATSGLVAVSPAKASAMNIVRQPEPDGTVLVPPQLLLAFNKAQEEKTRPPEQENPNHWAAVINDPQSTPDQVAKAKASLKTIRDNTIGTRVDVHNATAPQNQPPREIPFGSREYNVARDLATGKLTFSQFNRLYSRNTDTNTKLSIFDKAGEISNGAFNPADFERGYSFAKSPKVMQQVASINNAESGVADLLKFSDLAARTGSPLLNKAVIPGGINLGGKNYSNFAAARIGFADELSGALGFGGATDMAKHMGLDMTDPNLSPEAFKSDIQDVVIPFLNRKRSSMLGQMGPYGNQEQAQQPAQSAGGSAGQGVVSVQIPGHLPGKIPAAKLAEFQKAHPDAQVLQ